MNELSGIHGSIKQESTVDRVVPNHRLEGKRERPVEGDEGAYEKGGSSPRPFKKHQSASAEQINTKLHRNLPTKIDGKQQPRDMSELLDKVTRQWAEKNQSSHIKTDAQPQSSGECDDAQNDDEQSKNKTEVEQKRKEDEDKAALLYTDNITAACAATNELANTWSQQPSMNDSGDIQSKYPGFGYRQAVLMAAAQTGSQGVGIQVPLQSNSNNGQTVVDDLRRENTALMKENMSLKQEMASLKQNMASLLALVYPKLQEQEQQQQQQQQQPEQQQQSLPSLQAQMLLQSNSSLLGDSNNGMGPTNMTSLLSQHIQQQQLGMGALSNGTNNTGVNANNTPKNALLGQLFASSSSATSNTDLQRLLAASQGASGGTDLLSFRN